MSERLVWKLKTQLKLVRVRKSKRGLSCVCVHERIRQDRVPCCFQTSLSKDNFQVADEVVVHLLLSDLSYGDAGKPSVEIAAHQAYSYRAKQGETYSLLVLFKFNICCMKYDVRTVKVEVV